MCAYLIALGNLCYGLLKVGLEYFLIAVRTGVQWGLAECPVAVGVFPEMIDRLGRRVGRGLLASWKIQKTAMFLGRSVCVTTMGLQL